MPRDAPVTSAACPVRSNMGGCAQRLDAIDCAHVSLRRAALQHVRENATRTNLYEASHARAGEEVDRLLPAHRLHHLLAQVPADVLGVSQRLARDVAYHR